MCRGLGRGAGGELKDMRNMEDERIQPGRETQPMSATGKTGRSEDENGVHTFGYLDEVWRQQTRVGYEKNSRSIW